jgi:hypothetical protein
MPASTVLEVRGTKKQRLPMREALANQTCSVISFWVDKGLEKLMKVDYQQYKSLSTLIKHFFHANFSISRIRMLLRLK